MVSDPVQDNLRKIIAARKKGARKTPKAKAAEPVEQAGNVVNIMDALKRSIAAEQKRSEEHTSELQSLMRISYAVFCLKKKTREVHKATFSYHKTEHIQLTIEND